MTGRFIFARAPLRVYWELTRACDLACRHCRATAVPEPDPAELTTGEGLRLLDRLAGFGSPLPHLVLTGGDPLKRRDLFTLIEHARALGLGVSVAPSAATLLTAARHDALRGMGGTFDRTRAAAGRVIYPRVPDIPAPLQRRPGWHVACGRMGR